MENAMLSVMIIGIVIGSIVGAVVLMLLAKFIGKIKNAGFGNTFLICLMASSLNSLIWYLIGSDAYSMGFTGIFILNFILLSVFYLALGKLIWKCKWIQSLKANIIWILVYAVYMGYTLSKFS